MKVAYFDCFSGISGDMILGALVDAGLDVRQLESELNRLNLSGYHIRTEETKRGGIRATQLKVTAAEEQKERNLNDIYKIIEKSSLRTSVKTKSKQIFLRLAQTEAKVHGKAAEQIHFHEVGAVDAIVDIVGAVIGFEKLGIEKLYASAVHLGTGFVNSSHGPLPVPSPATAELLKGVPVYSTGIKHELTTPTGAAILTTLCNDFGEMPPMRVEKIGYGAGSRELPLPNLLRVLIGNCSSQYEQDKVVVLETNIDDMNPQFYEHIMESLFQKGAKDVFLTPVYMKKNRPGILLSIIASPAKVNEFLEIVFKETTTLGVRISEEKMRRTLKREGKIINTSYGEVKVKLSFIDGKLRDIAPEYEECKRIAEQYQLPIREVYDRVKKEAIEKATEENDRHEKKYSRQ